MEFSSFKPLLTALVMPPLPLLLLALLGLLLVRKHKRTGMTLVTLAVVLLWLVSCMGVASWLSRVLLTEYPPASAAQLKVRKVQAIVVLGGGVFPLSPEYGQAQPGPATAARLRYGIWLSRQTGIPLAFTGGTGRGASDSQQESEAGVAARVASQDYGTSIRWLESKSRDTSENARFTAPILKREGVQRIALVTDATHMQRASKAFEDAGMTVEPAATGYLTPRRNSFLEWLPSSSGLQVSHEVLHEWLGLFAGRWLPV